MHALDQDGTAEPVALLPRSPNLAKIRLVLPHRPPWSSSLAPKIAERNTAGERILITTSMNIAA
ncbi:hypothetical protein TRIUR3_34428 [Triticum urartu]|uniref:Uncharacterized protein n=1 Tax=Triticum urartu TaxID=4572 RepID=M7Z3A0_TRIUA|nr:hypothetical protein TRIUR3_34428 [Triticum urartu]